MKISPKTLALIGLLVEVAAFLRCLVEYVHLQFYAKAAIYLMRSPQPYLLGAFAALSYAIASFVLYRKTKFRASAILAGAMVVVLLALKLAYL